MKRADVAIVGGGSAAAAAALTLAATNLRVIAVAPRPSSRERAGDVLGAPGRALLGEIGIDTKRFAGAHRSSNTVYSCWGSDALVERNAFASTQGAGWVLDRVAYDTVLWEAMAGAVESIDDGVLCSACDDEGWHLETMDRRERIDARFVIDCSGRSAVVSRGFRRAVRSDRLVAVYAFLRQRCDEVEPTPAMLVEAVPGGWWYAALLPDRRLSVAFFTDADLVPRGVRANASVWRELIARTTYVRQWVESASYDLVERPRVASAASLRSTPAAGTNWAAAGDAAAAFDPLSSHGLSTALWSGRQAAMAAVEALEGQPQRLRSYASSIEDSARMNSIERRVVYGAERRFSDRPFWSRRSNGAL